MLWIDGLRPELDNFRSALEWDLERRPEAGLRLACALEMFWVFIGRSPAEGHDWLTRLLERAGPLPEDLDAVERDRIVLYARAYAAQSRASQALGQHAQVRREGEVAAALARRAGDNSTLAWALGLAAFGASMLGEYESGILYALEVLELTKNDGALWDRGVALISLIQISIRGRHDLAAAQGYREELERTFTRMGENPFLRAADGVGRGHDLRQHRRTGGCYPPYQRSQPSLHRSGSAYLRHYNAQRTGASSPQAGPSGPRLVHTIGRRSARGR